MPDQLSSQLVWLVWPCTNPKTGEVLIMFQGPLNEIPNTSIEPPGYYTETHILTDHLTNYLTDCITVHIETTYQAHTGHILTAYWPHLCWQHTDSILTTYVPTTYWPHMYWPHTDCVTNHLTDGITDHIPGTYWPHDRILTTSIQTTCQPHTDSMITTYYQPHTDHIYCTNTYWLHYWPD